MVHVPVLVVHLRRRRWRWDVSRTVGVGTTCIHSTGSSSSTRSSSSRRSRSRSRSRRHLISSPRHGLNGRLVGLLLRLVISFHFHFPIISIEQLGLLLQPIKVEAVVGRTCHTRHNGCSDHTGGNIRPGRGLERRSIAVRAHHRHRHAAAIWSILMTGRARVRIGDALELVVHLGRHRRGGGIGSISSR